AIQQIGPRDVMLDGVAVPINRTLVERREMQHGLANRLARNRPGMNANPTHGVATFDERHAFPKLRSAERALLPGGSGTNHDKIKGGEGHTVWYRWYRTFRGSG